MTITFSKIQLISIAAILAIVFTIGYFALRCEEKTSRQIVKEFEVNTTISTFEAQGWKLANKGGVNERGEVWLRFTRCE